MIDSTHICAFCEKLPAMGVRSCCEECWVHRGDLAEARAQLAKEMKAAVDAEEAVMALDAAELQVAPEFRLLMQGAVHVVRRLAPLPPSLIAVPRETLAKVREALEWIHDPDEDPIERFDRIADMFHRDTGFTRPGRSVPPAMGAQDHAAAAMALAEWVKKKCRESISILRAIEAVTK